LVDDYGYPDLAFSASIVSVYYFAVSMIVVYRDLGKSEFMRFARMSMRVVVPAIVMGLVVWGAKVILHAEDWYSLLQLGVLVPIGVVDLRDYIKVNVSSWVQSNTSNGEKINKLTLG
jgi:putative peptidoglycan lipid II flippase